MRVCIVGRGKVGRALHDGLRANRVDVRLLKAQPTPSHLPEADVYVLAVPDARIRALCTDLAPGFPPRSVVLHCAGARDQSELSAARDGGASVAAMHPLASFADPHKTPSLRGVTFVACGDKRALAAIERLTRALGAHCVTRPALGPAYHAAAALVANGGAALSHAGVKILRELGFSQQEASRGLAGLLRSVADNVAQLGVPAALTGPVVRGDASTVAAHLDALAPLDPQLKAAYAAVQPLVLACAEDAGLDPRSARKIVRALDDASPKHATHAKRTGPRASKNSKRASKNSKRASSQRNT